MSPASSIAVVGPPVSGRQVKSSAVTGSTGDDLSQWLERASGGNEDAVGALARSAHAELRRLAESLLSRERRDHTLQPSGLVNEAWLRLAATLGSPTWENRHAFFTGAATVMRRVLVDHARRRKRDKRGGGWERRPFDPVAEGLAAGGLDLADLLDLHDALSHFTTVNPRAAQVVELRIFAGLTIDETAALMDLSTGTVETEFKAARAWLRDKLDGGRP